MCFSFVMRMQIGAIFKKEIKEEKLFSTLKYNIPKNNFNFNFNIPNVFLLKNNIQQILVSSNTSLHILQIRKSEKHAVIDFVILLTQP